MRSLGLQFVLSNLTIRSLGLQFVSSNLTIQFVLSDWNSFPRIKQSALSWVVNCSLDFDNSQIAIRPLEFDNPFSRIAIIEIEGTKNGLSNFRERISIWVNGLSNSREQITIRENELSNSRERITNPWERITNPWERIAQFDITPVSYTHLTLPTICSV